MNKKVSLREIVATKIIFALMIASYYWMWERSDWKAYYITIQNAIGALLIVFFVVQIIRTQKYKREGIDEMAEQNLKRCDSICLKLFSGAMIIVAWLCALIGHVNAFSAGIIGWIIIISIIVISIIRTIMFIIMDSKGV